VATGEQLKALVKSYIDGDEERFFALALQVAAHEACRGQAKLTGFAKADIVWQHVAEAATGRSYVDITRACEDAAKERVLNDCHAITTENLLCALSEQSTLAYGGTSGLQKS
jgi:hypothetical protein